MSLWEKIKELVRRMLPKKGIEVVLNMSPAVSDEMARAIDLWADLYEGKAPWLKEPSEDSPVRVVSLGLPSLIASEKARMVTLEMKSEITAKQTELEASGNLDATAKPNLGSTLADTVRGKSEKSTERVDFLNKHYKKLLKQIRRQLEYGIAKGGLVIKPYILQYTDDSEDGILSYDKNLDKAEILFDFVHADRFFPLKFDANGKVTSAAFVQTHLDKEAERVYIRIELHTLEGRVATVKNFAFVSKDMSLANIRNIRNATNIGQPIPLSSVPMWASLSPETKIKDVDRLLFAYFRMPDANTIDPYSPLGVSGYSRVVSLIKDADEQYSRLLWEFEASEMAVDIDDTTLISENISGRQIKRMPKKQERLFRQVDAGRSDLYEIFAPAIRDASLIRGLNTILMRIEDATGLSRGTLSDVTTQEAKTATELKILKQRSYATNADIQAALQDALVDVVYVMDCYCTLYDITPPCDYEISFEWDDSILIDNESELTKRLTLMQNGLASKVETRMWYFGETEEQAIAALQRIEEEARRTAKPQAEADALMNKDTENTEGDTRSPADTTHKKISTGKQADSLENPDKSKIVDQIKNK